MLEQHGGYDQTAKIGYSEPCKPDYEAMIKRVNEMRVKNKCLTEAIFRYVGNSRLRGPLAELVGELVSEDRQIGNELEALIRAQEGE